MRKIGIGIVMLLLVGGAIIWSQDKDRRACEDRAVAAAVDWYPASDYPDTNERAQLQEDYKQRYITNECH